MKAIGTPLLLALAATVLAAGLANATPLADEAMATCNAASALRGAERAERLRDGLRLAESALAAQPDDVQAHLAVFCNLGRLTQEQGVGLSALGAVRRLTNVIDAAARLAPDDPDVLIARGAFLLELPRMLGGDPATGESLLRRALALAPTNCEAATRLATALAASGQGDEAAAVRGSC
jgi:cytochrome c-type biogenesis protein CcmH/NrfG